MKVNLKIRKSKECQMCSFIQKVSLQLIQHDQGSEVVTNFTTVSDDASLISAGESTEQSSTGWSGDSARAVDGNIDGNYPQ